MSLPTKNRRPGFTLVELLVVLALGAFLLGLLLMATQKVRAAANRVQCSNNLRQVCLAMRNAADVYQSTLPPLIGPYPAANKNYGTIFFHLLPFLEQNYLHQRANNYVWNNETCSVPVNVFLCPADRSGPPGARYEASLATCSYAANWLVFGTGGTRFPAAFTDGVSNTIAFTERYQLCRGTPCAWGYPNLYYWAPVFAYYSQGKFQPQPTQAQCDPARPQTPHPSGIWVGMADGGARLIANNVSPQTWWYACTLNGGETLGLDF